MPTHGEDRPTGVLRRRLQRGDGPMGECAACPMTPQRVQRVPCGGGRGQTPAGHGPGRRQPPAGRSGMRGTPSLPEDDGPAPPMGAPHRQAGLRRGVVPGLGDAPAPLTPPARERTLAHAPGMMARDRHRDVLPPSSVTGIQGRRRGAARCLAPQQDRAGPSAASPVAPPGAWRHVGERWASRGRGRCQGPSKRATATLPRCRETGRSWASRRAGVRRGAGQTVARAPNARGAWGRTAASTGSRRSCPGGGRPRRRPAARRSPSAAGRRARPWLPP